MNMDLDGIHKPTLLLDPHRCKSNIQRLIEKARAQRVTLRPHFKTHQSRLVGKWFREESIDTITVTSVDMANFFAKDGWKDIIIAFPVNIRQIDEIIGLAAKVSLGLVVVDEDTINTLGQKLKHTVNVWIKIDVGTHRTGIEANASGIIGNLLLKISSYAHLKFAGFLAHAGHTYQGRSKTEVQRIYDQSLDIVVSLKQKYIDAFPGLKLSLGDTPGASMVSQFGPVDELRPGNFVFYDLMQEEIGACTMDDIAVAMACPVVAVHPERLQWIIYGGGIHFSKDFLLMEDGKKYFGRMVSVDTSSWTTKGVKENPYIASLSQEHGVVQCTNENFNKCRPGDLTLWLPVHSCMTADAMGEYTSTDGGIIDHYRQHVYM
jgi:D-serine deaminase-like pyridoxal phosphate-dependent protein